MALRSSRKEAMTLVELLVALAIGFGLLLMFYGSMSGSASRFRAGESGLEANLIHQRVMEYLRKDLDGPFSLTPCNYPDEVVKAFNLGNDRIDFAIRKRSVDHRVAYYYDGRRTQAEAHSFPTEIKRKQDMLAPCQVSWDAFAFRWTKESPGGGEEWKNVLFSTHRLEAVSDLDNSGRRTGWVIGTALWVHDKAEGVLRRWVLGTDFDDFQEFGMGRLDHVSFYPVQEWAHQTQTVEDGTIRFVQKVKSMVRIWISVRRDEGRPALTMTGSLVLGS
jgi:type II secretory pathway pseudopilin PulG